MTLAPKDSDEVATYQRRSARTMTMQDDTGRQSGIHDKFAIGAWIDRLYGDAVEGLLIGPGREFVLWDRAHSGETVIHWVDDPDKAAEIAREFSAPTARSAYYHVCLHGWDLVGMSLMEEGKTANKQYNRGRRDSATVYPAAWLEVDFTGPGHKKHTLPSDCRDAIMLVREAIPLPPSAIVNSGGGIHVYWILEEPLILDNDADRQRAFSLNFRLARMVREQAAEHGWTVDSVHDLARVLRLPGTMNFKYNPPREVKLIPIDPAEDNYTVDAIEEILPDDKTTPEFTHDKSAPRETGGATFVVDFAALPPVKFMEFLAMDTDAKLTQTWARKRAIGAKAGSLSKDSASEYTMALVSRVMALGVWTDQELADLIMSWRIKHGELLKDGRAMSEANLRHKIAVTLNKGRRGAGARSDNAEIAHSALMMTADTAREHAAKGIQPDHPLDGDVEILSNLSATLGVEIVRVEVAMGTGGGVYSIVLSGNRRIDIGAIQNISNAQAFRDRIFDRAGVQINRYKAVAWDPLALLIRMVAEEIDIPGEREVEVDMLIQYCSNVGVYDDVDQAAIHRNPFWRPSDRRLSVFAPHYLRWRRVMGVVDPGTVRKLYARVRALGLGDRGTQGLAGGSTTCSVVLMTDDISKSVRARCSDLAGGHA